MVAGSMEIKVFVASWSHTWGEFRDVCGVFLTYKEAKQALVRMAPNADHEIEEFILGAVDETSRDLDVDPVLFVCRECGRRVTKIVREIGKPTTYEPCGHQDLLSALKEECSFEFIRGEIEYGQG